MLLSKSCEYAIRAALCIATQETVGYTSVRQISEVLKTPAPFLAKIAQTLTQAGILRALRGPNGGVALARPAGAIMLKEIVLAMDGPDIFTVCVLGLPGCGHRQPCPLHHEWMPARERIDRMFGAVTLADTAASIRAQDYRLAFTTADV